MGAILNFKKYQQNGAVIKPKVLFQV